MSITKSNFYADDFKNDNISRVFRQQMYVYYLNKREMHEGEAWNNASLAVKTFRKAHEQDNFKSFMFNNKFYKDFFDMRDYRKSNYESFNYRFLRSFNDNCVGSDEIRKSIISGCKTMLVQRIAKLRTSQDLRIKDKCSKMRIACKKIDMMHKYNDYSDNNLMHLHKVFNGDNSVKRQEGIDRIEKKHKVMEINKNEVFEMTLKSCVENDNVDLLEVFCILREMSEFDNDIKVEYENLREAMYRNRKNVKPSQYAKSKTFTAKVQKSTARFFLCLDEKVQDIVRENTYNVVKAYEKDKTWKVDSDKRRRGSRIR